MNNSVGQKIMKFAGFILFIGIVLFGIYGISLIKSNHLFGIVVMVVGFTSTWIIHLCLYGYGELLDNTAANREINERILEILESQYSEGKVDD